MPALRYDSSLLEAPARRTAFFASIPNLAQYLGEAQTVLRQKLAESPELRAWWAGQVVQRRPGDRKAARRQRIPGR